MTETPQIKEADVTQDAPFAEPEPTPDSFEPATPSREITGDSAAQGGSQADQDGSVPPEAQPDQSQARASIVNTLAGWRKSGERQLASDVWSTLVTLDKYNVPVTNARLDELAGMPLEQLQQQPEYAQMELKQIGQSNLKEQYGNLSAEQALAQMAKDGAEADIANLEAQGQTLSPEDRRAILAGQEGRSSQFKKILEELLIKAAELGEGSLSQIEFGEVMDLLFKFGDSSWSSSGADGRSRGEAGEPGEFTNDQFKRMLKEDPKKMGEAIKRAYKKSEKGLGDVIGGLGLKDLDKEIDAAAEGDVAALKEVMIKLVEKLFSESEKKSKHWEIIRAVLGNEISQGKVLADSVRDSVFLDIYNARRTPKDLIRLFPESKPPLAAAA